MITASVVGDAVFAFDVDLPLRMVGADMAVVAGLGSADLFEAELMTYVAFCALPHRAIRRRCAHGVAALTGEVRNC